MWYVIQARSGEEELIKRYIEELQDRESYGKLFIPLYEEVRRSGGNNKIIFRKMFPGYLFIETEAPEHIYDSLKKIPKFKRILSMGEKKNEDERLFIPVGSEDQAFLESVTDDGVMHVSYIRMKNHRYIEKMVGPLARYRNHISKLDIPHRRAIVDAELFGKRRRIRFGLWAEGDPPLHWIDVKMGMAEELPVDQGAVPDIGIHPGDRVKDDTGIYAGMEFTVISVNPGRRTVNTTFTMNGITAGLELSADQVTVVV